ncbi:FecR domain-containing protein [Dechloromonas sp. ZY10]|uniref:FecR family protein n=1 Tax=Dechloromonas aquae TaxID=2664436 RepID=UPI003527B405
MQRMAVLAAVIFALGGVSTVEAAASARIDAAQGPVWLERHGERQPVLAGMELQNRDRVVTGSGGRVLVRLADGSAVKVGEDGSYAFNAMQQQTQRGRPHFAAAIDVAKGAFRLTTEIFHKYRSDRTINVRSGTVTIGVRGTDVWGRAAADRDFVCLLEGKVVATHPQAEPVSLDTPLAFYGAERGQAPGPVQQASSEQVAQWAGETELQPDRGVQQAGGRWQLRYGPFTKDAVLAHYDRLRAAGYAARIEPRAAAEGGYAYRLKFEQLRSEEDAAALEIRLANVDRDLPAADVRRR